MQIVIDIEEERYNQIKHCADNFLVGALERAVKNGTPLPKGHGRLLDENEILNIYANDGEWYDLEDMPEYIEGVSAVIEATKESE